MIISFLIIIQGIMKFNNEALVKRLGIFVFYDSKGHAYDYVKYILEDIIVNFQELYIVSNGSLDFETFQYFSNLTKNVYVRENEGLDAAAFKRALTCYIGWNKLQDFDEIVLFNDTFYGPFFEFKNIFHEMDAKDYDFWGISAGYKAVDGWNVMPYKYIPDHIQTFFMAFRKEMFCADDFKNYWMNLPDWKSFFEVVTQHELILTDLFSKMGYKWGVFSNTELYKSDDINKNYNLYAYSAFDMVKKLRFPFIKRKNFTEPRASRLYMGNTYDLGKVVRYVQKDTEYDINLIYQDLINHNNVKTLYESMNMNYVLPSNLDICDKNVLKDCLIVIQCNGFNGLKSFIPNLKELGKFCDIAFLFSNKMDIQEIEKVLLENKVKYKTIKSISSSIQGIPALWLLGRDIQAYKYLCFLHDCSYYKENFPEPIYDNLLCTLQENTIKNCNFLYNTLKLLENNEYLGLLETPFALHNRYFHYLADYWESDFENIKKMANILGLKCFLDDKIGGISRGGAFICKTNIFNEILKLEVVETDYQNGGLFSEFTPIQWEKILPYMCQHYQLFTGIIMSNEYAALEITNLKFYFADLLKRVYDLEGNKSASYGMFGESLSNKISLLKTRENFANDEEMSRLRSLLEEKDRRIRSLVALTSIKTQLKLRIKKKLPSFAYKGVVALKRLLLGPRNIPLIPDEEEINY